MKKEEIMFLVKEFMDTQTAMEVRDVLDQVLKKETETMVNSALEAQRQEPVDLNSYEEQKALRTKALEVAVSLFKTSLTPTTNTADVVVVAQRFYTYITKGE